MNKPNRSQKQNPNKRLNDPSKQPDSESSGSPSPYCTLFLCTLEQLTALSVGGRDGDADGTLHDLPLARDGKGRPVLNGRTLAGALVATARTFLAVPDDISLIGGAPDDRARPPSLWSVWNAHRLHMQAQGPETDSRPGSAQRHDTRAAASHMLFDTEVLPSGQHWQMIIEVWHPASAALQQGAEPSPGRRAAAVLALTLQEWARGRCWIGRRVARGLGWMRLADCQVVELPRSKDAVNAWPKASLADLDAIWNHALGLSKSAPGTLTQSLVDYAKSNALQAGARAPRRAYVRWPLRLATGVHEVTTGEPACTLSYGLDVLSVGGHGGSAVVAEALENRLVRSQEQHWKAYSESFAPDFVVAMQPGSVVPDVPGSAIAGAWRHFLSRLARAAGQAVLDPATGAIKAGGAGPQDGAIAAQDVITPLFGFVSVDGAASSALLVRDASMAPGSQWKVALLEKVALDEFTQGAFKGAKFNRMAVLEGQWQFDLVQEIDLEESDDMPPMSPMQRIQQSTALVWGLLEATAQRRVAVGGGEFRAYGHLPVTVDAEPGCQWAVAGEDWQSWPAAEPDQVTAQHASSHQEGT